MAAYRPTPRMGRRLRRLEELTALRRALTEDEQREVMWLANRQRVSENRRKKYAEDAEWREAQKAKSRQWQRDNYGYRAID